MLFTAVLQSGKQVFVVVQTLPEVTEASSPPEGPSGPATGHLPPSLSPGSPSSEQPPSRRGRLGRSARASLPATPPPYLFDHHAELALGAEHRLDARQPLDAGEDLGRANEHLAWVEAIGIIEEETLQDWGPEEGPCECCLLGGGGEQCPHLLSTPGLHAPHHLRLQSSTSQTSDAHKPPGVLPTKRHGWPL